MNGINLSIYIGVTTKNRNEVHFLYFTFFGNIHKRCRRVHLVKKKFIEFFLVESRQFSGVCPNSDPPFTPKTWHSQWTLPLIFSMEINSTKKEEEEKKLRFSWRRISLKVNKRGKRRNERKEDVIDIFFSFSVVLSMMKGI